MDEAGYGPNLGPLVITATVWQVPGDPRKTDFWKSLEPVVSQSATKDADGIHVAEGDLPLLVGQVHSDPKWKEELDAKHLKLVSIRSEIPLPRLRTRAAILESLGLVSVAREAGQEFAD